MILSKHIITKNKYQKLKLLSFKVMEMRVSKTVDLEVNKILPFRDRFDGDPCFKFQLSKETRQSHDFYGINFQSTSKKIANLLKKKFPPKKKKKSKASNFKSHELAFGKQKTHALVMRVKTLLCFSLFCYLRKQKQYIYIYIFSCFSFSL